MFVFETLMNVYEKVKFDSTKVDVRFRTPGGANATPGRYFRQTAN
ncbi:hypothetical protein BN2476_230059 [Paraburkholderia piptadeniae]|uniref:Uncharacterized protein n=1 Tax=Paraburkholderia piptadeniae TaxID=1701573 RepID=A0A1N7RWR0_9BURK|nr:hypothetical protein BN2476_230059 [Paraburkholderia piptadeniae]